jgi:hypothetical protein
MLRAMTGLMLSVTVMSCGVPNANQLHDIGTNIEPAQRTLEVMVGFDNDETLERQFRLLSRAAGLTDTLSVQLYGAIDLEGEYVEFLATPGLKYGDIVREGAVFKFSSTVYLGDQFSYKIGDDYPKTWQGHDFEQSEKDGALIALSGHLHMPHSAADKPQQNPEGGEAKKLFILCKNFTVKQPYTEEWRKIGCDLNIVNGKLQISYLKTAANPEGTRFDFVAPTVL